MDGRLATVFRLYPCWRPPGCCRDARGQVRRPTLVIPGPCGIEFPIKRQQQLPDAILPLIKCRTADIPIVHRGRGPLDLHTLVRDEKKMRLSATGPNGQFRQTSISNITTVSEASARINRDIDIHNPLFGFTLDIPDRQRIIGHIDKTTPDRKTLSRQNQGHCGQPSNKNHRFHFLYCDTYIQPAASDTFMTRQLTIPGAKYYRHPFTIYKDKIIKSLQSNH